MSRLVSVTTLASALAGAVLLACSGAQPSSASEPPVDEAPAPAAAESEPTSVARALGREFSQVARDATPAVVFVETEREVEVAGLGGDRSPFPGLGTPFGDDFFFRHFGPWRSPDATPERHLQRGQGSGFLIDADGTIITNAHVVEGAKSIRVRLQDGRDLPAELVGADTASDVAVIDIDGDPFPHLTLGDSDGIDVGEWVVAVGNPFGLTATVTAGIVSAKGRTRVGIAEYEDFIQTDAAINPGNSGGPLLDLDGKVVGVNSAIVSRSGGSLGIGFAIPVNLVREIHTRLADDGEVVRGFLGVYLQDLTPELAPSFGADGRTGALVSEVMEDTPAGAAGLRNGDVVLSLDGHAIEDSAELRNRIALLRPGTKIRLGVLRDGDELEITAELARRDKGPVAAEVEAEAATRTLGLEVAPLTRGLAGVPAHSGVLVQSVRSGSPAARAGLQSGEVITSVGRRPVKSVAEFEAAIAKVQDGAPLLLRVHDGRGARYVSIRVR